MAQRWPISTFFSRGGKNDSATALLPAAPARTLEPTMPGSARSISAESSLWRTLESWCDSVGSVRLAIVSGTLPLKLLVVPRADLAPCEL